MKPERTCGGSFGVGAKSKSGRATKMKAAFQDFYPEKHSHCYGCGRSNPHGLGLKSYWDGEDTIAHFTPPLKFSGGFPGNAYGGLIASLLDCHGTASAAATAHRQSNGETGDASSYPRFV